MMVSRKQCFLFLLCMPISLFSAAEGNEELEELRDGGHYTVFVANCSFGGIEENQGDCAESLDGKECGIAQRSIGVQMVYGEFPKDLSQIRRVSANRGMFFVDPDSTVADVHHALQYLTNAPYGLGPIVLGRIFQPFDQFGRLQIVPEQYFPLSNVAALCAALSPDGLVKSGILRK